MSKRLELIEQMIAQGSTDPFHHYARAMELRSVGRDEEALAAFAEVRQRFPEYVPTYLMAGQVYLSLERADEAREWLSRGIEVAEAEGNTHAVSELTAALAEADA